jgi:hypothetical protein
MQIEVWHQIGEGTHRTSRFSSRNLMLITFCL